MAAPLFTSAPVDSVAILLVDTSGSVRQQFEPDGKLIWNRMCEVAHDLPHEKYRVIFWNSDEDKNSLHFPGGISVIPFVVKQSSLKSTFTLMFNRITSSCLTYPHLGFRALQQSWKTPGVPIYLLTDGEMGYHNISYREKEQLQVKLAQEISPLKNVRLSIITVEATQADMKNSESIKNIAGGDVFKVIQKHKLTQMITKFTSVTPQGSFHHINRNTPAPGFLPWGDLQFSESRVSDFIIHLRASLEAADTDQQLEMAQRLANTLHYLVKDKPRSLVKSIIKTFVSCFSMEQDMIQFILTEAINREEQGQAEVLADYHRRRKNLFKEADHLIRKDVKQAIGIDDSFMTFPMEDHILYGAARMITASITIHGRTYPQGAMGKVPVLPMGHIMGTMTEQCLRQWFRTVSAEKYQLHPYSDCHIYLAMGMNFIATQSEAPHEVQDAMRQLAQVMLKKTRAHSMQTELQRISAGELPIPNSGKLVDFYGFMRAVSMHLHIEAKPLKLWLEMCRAVDPEIYEAQKVHLKQLPEDLYSEELKAPRWTFDGVPRTSLYDYTCIITLQSVVATGGFIIKPHNGPVGPCSPMYVLSEDGKTSLLQSANCMCPICYESLRADQFEPIGPQEKFKLPVEFTREYYDLPLAAVEEEKKSTLSAPGSGRKLVLLQGVVGSGKSTAAQWIYQTVTERGGQCVILSPDEFCSQGIPPRQAVGRTKQKAHQFMKQNKNKQDVVVVVDTCGERHQNNSKIFGQNFAGWERITVRPNYKPGDLKGYLSWSLHNVLTRGACTSGCGYWLNPSEAGQGTCIDVHRKKCGAIFGWNKWTFVSPTKETLARDAESYRSHLEPFTMSI